MRLGIAALYMKVNLPKGSSKWDYFLVKE